MLPGMISRAGHRRAGTLASVFCTISGTNYIIKDSYNVASVTRPAQGRALIKFDLALPDAYYGVLVGARPGNFADSFTYWPGPNCINTGIMNETGVDICFVNASFGVFDADHFGAWIYDPAAV